jgi:spore maturation protein CgeB
MAKMKILCVFGQHNYGDPARGLAYEYANFLPALQRLGYNVEFFESWNRLEYRDFADLNQQLLETIARVRPDIIFFVSFTYEIWLETLDLIRRHCPSILISWGTDDSWKYEQSSRFIGPHVDMHATTDTAACAKATRDGIDNFVTTQWAADADKLTEPLPAKDCRHAVSFIGTAYGNRPGIIQALKRRGIDVTCFGYGWPNGSIPSEDIPRIIRESVISLNFADSGIHGLLPRRYRQIKARTFEIPGAGGFLLTENVKGLSEFFVPDKEVAVFDGVDELARKIDFFLMHLLERDRIAWAGHERARKEHTYDVRFHDLLRRATEFHQTRSGPSPQPQKCKFDWGAFDEMKSRHKPGIGLRILRRLLVLPCNAIFGSIRGPRAARRMLYEISWRLTGETTYSVSGWPGRIFYLES